MYQNNKLPWIIFRIDDSKYAINSEIVTSIFPIPEVITQVPNSPDYVAGIANLRGEIITLIRMRTLFSLDTIEEEFEEFKNMIDRRKQDHINWVKELKRTVETKEEFKLATDPHKCKLGVWYDNFTTDNSVIKFQLNKLDKPHKKLHSMVAEVERCEKKCNECERDECLLEVLDENLNNLERQILGILDATKDAFKRYYRPIGISIQNSDMKVAIIIDEVLAIKDLDFIYDDTESKKLYDSKFVLGTATDNDDLILIINDKAITDITKLANIDTTNLEIPC